MFMLPWPEAFVQGTDAAGGKGWNLARLQLYGFPVPPGGVVSTKVYRLFLSHPNLSAPLAAAKAITDAASPEAGAVLARLRDAMDLTPLPTRAAEQLDAFLAAAGLAQRPVAVRSSATAEDSAEASFAGIHRSFLNVVGTARVQEAVKRCYASLWTPQAIAYRRRMNLPDDEVGTAVVILEMVPTRTAGVAFSCDPRSGRQDRVMISAALGLGESVVGGTVEPDEYELDLAPYPPAVIGRRIGRKAAMVVPGDGSGVESVTVAPAEAARPALTDTQAAELALLTLRVFDSLGEMTRPQDLEWAHDGERFWLLQARPVTGLPPAAFPAILGQPVIWSNANLKDVMPGVQSTLGWSFARASMELLLSAPLKAGGWPYAGGMTWIRLLQGRAYFNLSAIQWAFYDCIGLSPAETNRIIGGHQPEIAVPPAGWRDRIRRQLAKVWVMRESLRVMGRAEAEFQRLWAWAESAEQAERSGITAGELLARTLEVKRIMEEFLPRFQIINGAAGGTLQELIKLIRPAFGDRAGGLVNAMLAGASRVTSALQGERLVQLGNEALDEPAVRSFFAADDWRPQEWAERLEGTRFKADFTEYLKEYGHRGVYEIEPMNPRWREDPTYLLEIVQAQVRSGRRIQLEDQSARREAAVREVFGRLGWGPRAIAARFYLAQTIRSSALREMAKSVVVKVAGISRLLALETGRRLAAAGLIEQTGDLFHLSWADMEAFLVGRPCAGDGYRALVADRKALREIHLGLEPPDVIIGETPVKMAPAPPAAAAGAGERAWSVLTGMGVASGQATGTVRVIRHPDEGSRLQPGEVLVAPSTDPAWTPLFLRASAVVMEVGGYLSHGAIVAREYGLPAVVNVPGLLQALRDGETVTVDGDSGKVYRSAP